MGLLVGIHAESYRKSSPYQDRYTEILKHNGIPLVIMDANKPDFWGTVGELSHFIYRWEHYEEEKQLAEKILPVIEHQYHIPCFPDQATTWHYDDKIKQYYLMHTRGFPYVRSWIFWSKKDALGWLEDAEMPVVAKLKGGAGSKNVRLIHSTKKARKYIYRRFGMGHMPSSIDRNTFNLRREVLHLGGNLRRFLKGVPLHDTWVREKNYVLFQEFLPDNRYDIRITTIGQRAFAFRRRVRENDFRASGSGMIDYNTGKIDTECIKIALEVSRELHFQTMAYDFIYNKKNEPEICEISYTYLDEPVYRCDGYWDAEMNWHQGHFWPQYFQLMDLLDIPDLKQIEDN